MLGGFDNKKNGILYSGTLDEIKSETIKLINTVGKKRYNTGGGLYVVK